MFGLANHSVPDEEVTLESLPALPTAALRHRYRYEYLMGVAKERNEASASEPGLLQRVVRDFLQATHWAAPKNPGRRKLRMGKILGSLYRGTWY